MERMTLKDLKGLTVISIADGARVGKISRIYLDPAAKKIVGFSVDPGNSLVEPDSSKMIDVDDVHALGPDALTVDDANAVRGDNTNALWMSLIDVDQLTKRKVVSEGGELIGNVASIEFDPSGFALTGIEVSPGFFKGNKVVPTELVTTIGPELVIVSDAVFAQATPEPTPEAYTEEESADALPLTRTQDQPAPSNP